ncbi:hypothetical protein Tco_0960403 [Tanacetum coccineum]
MEAPPPTVDGHHRATHRTTRIDLWYPCRMYVSGRVDIFDMVDIDLFIVVALNMMVLKLGYTGKSEPMFYNYLKPLTSLDEGLYALACEEDVCCLGSYLRAPQFRATLEEITNEASSIATNRNEKTLLLTWHEFSETTKEPVCESVTSSSLPQHDSSAPCKDSVCESITPRCMSGFILTPPTDEFVITCTQLSGVQGVDTQIHVLPTIQTQFSDINLSFVSQQATATQVIDDVMRQLSFDETELDGEAGFANVAGGGVDSSGLSHDESFGVNDMDLNLNEPEPILSEVSTQEPIVAEVSNEVPILEEVGTQEFSVEDVVVEDYVSSGEDAEHGTYDDDDVNEDFLVDEENEIVEPDVDFHLFDISMDLPFDNIGTTNLVSDDVLEREDVDVINADGFDSDPGNDEEKNYMKRRLAELRTEIEGVRNVSGQWKYSFYIGQKFTTSKEAKDRVHLHSIESRRNLKLYKNDGVRIRTRCQCHKIFEQVRINPDIPVKAVQDQLQRELEVQISMSKTFKAKAKAEREIRGDHVLQYSMLRDYVVELQSTNPNTTIKITVERNSDPSLPTKVF